MQETPPLHIRITSEPAIFSDPGGVRTFDPAGCAMMVGDALEALGELTVDVVAPVIDLPVGVAQREAEVVRPA